MMSIEQNASELDGECGKSGLPQVEQNELEEFSSQEQDTQVASEASETQKLAIEELEKNLARVRADFHNYKARMDRDAEKRKALAAESLVSALLPVYDNLERTLSSLEVDSPIYKGIAMVSKQFFSAMEEIGLEKIDTSGKFNPALHEALGVVAVEDLADDEKIIDVFQQGFALGGRVLRASKVRVGKKS